MAETDDSGVIWWDELCGHNNIYDSFWDLNLTWYTATPDFTVCFQQSAICWVTCGLLWVMSLVYLPFLHHKPTKHTWKDLSYLNLSKLVLVSCLVALSVGDLTYYTTYDCHTSCITLAPSHYVEAAVLISTYLLAGWLTYWEYLKGVHSSGVMFIFWIFRVIASIISVRSHVLRRENRQIYGYDQFLFVTTVCLLSVTTLLSIANIWADKQALNPTRGRHTSSRGHPEERARLLGDDVTQDTPTVEPCPMKSASFLSKLFFAWFTPLIWRGYRRKLTDRDIFDLSERDKSCNIVPRFTDNWEQEIDKYTVRFPSLEQSNKKSQVYGSLDNSDKTTQREPRHTEPSAREQRQGSLLKTLIATFGCQFLWPGILVFLTQMTPFINPFILQSLIAFVESGDPYVWRGYLYVGIMCVLSLVFDTVMNHQYFYLIVRLGMRIRTALAAEIYRKALRLSSKSRQTNTVGEIVNLMSVDVQKIQSAPVFIHYLWLNFLSAGVGTTLLWQYLGPSCLAGVGFMFIILPINSMFVARKMRTLQIKQMGLKDRRIKMMSQILNGIKVLKLYAWEPYFEERVKEIRQEEVKVIRHQAYLYTALLSVVFRCSTVMMTLLCFLTYVLTSPDHVLDAQTTFVSLTLINITGIPISLIPQGISFIVQGYVSVKRINAFLLQPDVNAENVKDDFSLDCAIEINNGSFSWSNEDKVTLKGINLSVPRGCLVAVVGAVGCGKSSLISALLGEIEVCSGSVVVNGSVSYVPQQAWIQNMTLKQNVLFSRSYSQGRYDEVLDACALKHDLKLLPAGDETEIGEKGINLSGGQKQRVSLARAVYQDHEVYLLDDPLSAVDAHVGKHIFNKVIGKDGILKDKTRVLVTHGVSYLPEVDRIVVLTDGGISEQGTYDELLSHQGSFAEFITQYLATDSEEPKGDGPRCEDTKELKRMLSELTQSGSLISDGTNSHEKLRRRHRGLTTQQSVLGEEQMVRKQLSQYKDKLIQDEDAVQGKLSWSFARSYLRAATYPMVVLLFLAYIGYIVFQVLGNIWLSEWSADQVVNGTQDRELLNLRLGVYAGLGVMQTLMMLGLCICIAMGSMIASATLHSALLSNVLRCPMAFFDTTPIGRIVNRFSKDIDTCDTAIPSSLLATLTSSVPVLVTVIIMSYSTPIFIAPLIPLAIVYVMLQRLYLSAARQLTGIDSVRRSPLYAYFNECLTGVSSIRAYRQQSRFIEHNDRMLDHSQAAFFANITSRRWLGICAQSTSSFIVFFAGLFAVLQRDTLSPSLVGLSVSFALQVSFNTVWTLINSCQLENNLVAVERIREYSEMETEADWTDYLSGPPADWPRDGHVEICRYATRYRNGLGLVLNDITCHFNPGEMVGVVGRTGAGKSSLALALFRVMEAESGSICIDGHDISRLGLHQLRSKLTIIPQDPVLFSGSLRFNIDPSGRFTDEEVWSALDHAHLKEYVSSLPTQLEHECGEDGGNLSVGQRQLLCLARALLRRTRVLVLDEATAAVDLETDDLIQQTIRSQFSRCTVITIAHRLNTVLDYNRVMVLSEGRIVEMDSPEKLLADRDSVFYGLATDAGLV